MLGGPCRSIDRQSRKQLVASFVASPSFAVTFAARRLYRISSMSRAAREDQWLIDGDKAWRFLIADAFPTESLGSHAGLTKSCLDQQEMAKEV